MTTPLPDPRSLFGAMTTLDRAIGAFESSRAAQRYTSTSSDSAVTSVIDGLGALVSLSIAESQMTVDPAVLAAKVRDTVNAAMNQASAATAALVGTFASTLSLPGLPAYGQSAPAYRDFSWAAEQLTAQILANIPCESPDVFSCTFGHVAAVVDAGRHVISLTFAEPLPPLMLDLAVQTAKALNCALDESTNQPTQTNGTTVGIIDSKGLGDLALYANGTLKIDDRAHVLGPNCVGFAAVANAGTGETNIGVGSELGSVTSVAKVIVREGGKVHGFLQTADTYEPHPDNVIDGTITEHGVVILPNLSLNIAFPGVTQGTVEPGVGQTKTAAPGYFDKCHPMSNAQVYLSSGVYYFNDVLLEPDSKVWLDTTNGPIVIWVKNSFTFRGAFLNPAGGFPRVFVGYLGTELASIERPYNGTLCAPNAKINLASITSPDYEGSFHAKDIEVQPDSRICFHPFELLYSELPGTGTPPVPTVDLGFETTQGWSCAQALLTWVPSPVTQGAHALQITNVTGPFEIVSANFASSVAPSGSARLLVDLWIPSYQPNPSNWGNLTAVMSIPSAGITNVTLGSDAITGKPLNQFSTFEFQLPAAIRTAMASARSDVSMKLQLSANSGTSPWYLDNIRFALAAPPPSLDGILSFEDVTKWSCGQTSISTSTDHKSNLTYALKFTNVPSWLQLVSVAFSSETIAAPTGAMLVDLWLPLNQPNPNWYGQVQVSVDVPSAGIYSAWLGQVDLTSKRTNQFNSLRFTLPANVKAAIDGTYEDVKLTITFTLPSGAGPYYVDYIRFV